MVLASSAFSADLNSTNPYPSGIVRDKIGYRFVYTVDVRWVKSWIEGKEDTFSCVSRKEGSVSGFSGVAEFPQSIWDIWVELRLRGFGWLFYSSGD